MMTPNDDLKHDASAVTMTRTPLDVNKFSEDAKGLTEEDVVQQQETPSQANKIADITQQQLGESDIDRMRVATGLLNNFNYAIQVQARRAQWTVDDWRAFIIALQALDGIGRAVSDQQRLANLDQDVQDTVKLFGKRT